MRFKYYLRGMGIGITFATLLLTISFYFGRDNLTKKDLTDEEIIQQATALGMVMPDEVEDEIAAEEDIKENTEEITKNSKQVSDKAVDKTDTKKSEKDLAEKMLESGDVDEVITYVPFTVRGGESSEVICSHLKDAGLIDSADDFNKYLHKCKVDDRIPNGTFYVKQGSSYDDIVALLVNKDVRTTSPPKN